MQLNEHTAPISNERVERLICRQLDGEITPDERIELERTLASDPEAQVLMDDYRGIDGTVRAALQSDYESAMAAAAAGRHRTVWLAGAGLTLAAAAAIAFSLISGWTGNGGRDRPNPIAFPGAQQAARPPSSGMQFIDYRDEDYQPALRETDTWRDVIGVRAGEDVIYILERNHRTTRIVPVSGDF